MVTRNTKAVHTMTALLNMAPTLDTSPTQTILVSQLAVKMTITEITPLDRTPEKWFSLILFTINIIM